MVELYFHSSTCLHGIVLNYLSTGRIVDDLPPEITTGNVLPCYSSFVFSMGFMTAALTVHI
jgi:hypothetical protein